MEVRERPSAQDAAELRLRLYRPDPPPGAVDAYLEALARLPTVPEPQPLAARAATAPRPGRRLRLAGLAVVGAAALVAVALVVRDAPAPAGFSAPPRAPAPTSDPAPADRFPSVPGTVVGVMAGDRASRRTFDAGGDRVVVSLLCSGGGSLSLRLGSEPPTALSCEKRGSGLAMVPSATAFDSLTVAVTPAGPVEFSLAIGTLDPGADLPRR